MKGREEPSKRDSAQAALNSAGCAGDPSSMSARVSIKSIISSEPGAKASLSITYGFILLSRSFCEGIEVGITRGTPLRNVFHDL